MNLNVQVQNTVHNAGEAKCKRVKHRRENQGCDKTQEKTICKGFQEN